MYSYFYINNKILALKTKALHIT